MMLSNVLRTNLDSRMEICQGREVYHQENVLCFGEQVFQHGIVLLSL